MSGFIGEEALPIGFDLMETHFLMEMKMPKLKTKSSVKRRFKVTGTGRVMSTQANKQHNMRKRSKRQLRNQRGTVLLCDVEAKRALYFMPYGL